MAFSAGFCHMERRDVRHNPRVAGAFLRKREQGGGYGAKGVSAGTIYPSHMLRREGIRIPT